MPDLLKMNEAQREAVTHGEGPLLVLAGPGSGKTFTITQRIFYLLQERNVLPHQILVVTFTKEAALSMQRRFQEQADQNYPVNFGTFHSVFYHILRQSHSVPIQKIASKTQKQAILRPFLETISIEPQESCDISASFLDAFGFYKNTGEESGAKEKLPEKYRPFFREAFDAYEKERRNRNLIDFDDMVYECRELLEKDAEVRKYWQNRFTHILMDEFQDINPMQYEAVKLLAGGGCGLFAVGDDDQSIYGFRGSRPACLKQFSEEFEARKVYLTVNYRSREAIVNASLKVISENKDRFVKNLSALPHGEEENMAQGMAEGRLSDMPVRLLPFVEQEEQYSYLEKQLEQFWKNKNSEDENWGDGNQKKEQGAVLFRTHFKMQEFAARLSRAGIPYTMKEKAVSIYEHFMVKDIMAYLRLASGEENRELFLQILNKPLRYLNREAVAKPVHKTEEIFREMKRYYGAQEQMPRRRERLEALEKLEKDLQYLSRLSLPLRVRYLFKGVGYEKYLKEIAGSGKEAWQDLQEMEEWLCEDARGYEDVEQWRKAQKEYEQALENRGAEEGKPIQLMTVHASKGLEFDRVWIPDCNEKVFPHGSMPDTNACEEERRIFYVAMTRAKKNLELLYLTGTKERPRLPSRFLNPLLSR